MATQLREQLYTPLSRDEALDLVKEIWRTLDRLAMETPENDDEHCGLGVLDDVSISTGEPLPLRPVGTTEALERMASCRSTLTIDYYARVFDSPLFIALQKLVFARAGEAVVWRGEGGEAAPAGAKIMTVEACASEWEKDVGPEWRETRPLGMIEEPAPKAPIKTRKAKPGELESLAVHKRLAAIIEGRDPFARDALKKALEDASPSVRAYAAALMENGPSGDGELSKELGAKASDVASARAALGALLKTIR